MSPSTFVAEWVDRLAPPEAGALRALDVAMGRGRHATLLARAGFRTFGVDANLDAVRETVEHARGAGLVVHAFCADLTRFRLPDGHFDLVVVARYLQRDLFPDLRATVRPGGVVLYETFTTAQRALGFGPKSPEHLLEPGELRERFRGFDVLFYEEILRPEAVARIVARRPREART